MALSRNQRLILELLATRRGEISGIDLANFIGGLARSSVYAALSALQRDGLVDARWDHEEPHPRRMVRINDAGLAALAEEQQAMRTALRSARRSTRRSTT